MTNTAKAMWDARVAIEQNDLDQLKAMLAQQPELATLSINTQPGYRNLMHIAAASGNPAICAYLHAAGVALDAPAPRESRVTPLTEAAGSGQLATVDWLLQQGARVDGDPQAVANPLLNACRFGHHEVAARLLQAGADVNRLHANLHQTPLDLALVWKHAELQTLLEEHGGQAIVSHNPDWSQQHLGAIADYVHTTAGPVLPLAYRYAFDGREVALRIANVENKWRYKLLFTLGLADFAPATELFVCLTDNWPVSASAQACDASVSFPMRLLHNAARTVVAGTPIEQGLLVTPDSDLAAGLTWPEQVAAMLVVDYLWNPQGQAQPIDDPVKLLMFVPLATLDGVDTPAKLAKLVEKKRKARWNAIALPFEP